MTDLQARIKRELEIAYKNGILHATGQSFTEPEVAVQVGCDMIARAIREALLSEEVMDVARDEEMRLEGCTGFYKLTIPLVMVELGVADKEVSLSD